MRSSSMTLTMCLTLLSFGALSAEEELGLSYAYPIEIKEDHRTPSDDEAELFVRHWLRCYECRNGELKRVIRGRQKTRDILQSIVTELDSLLPTSPIADSRIFGILDEKLEARWDAIKAHADTAKRDFNIAKADFVESQKRAIYEGYLGRAQSAIVLIDRRPSTDPPRRREGD